jgi:hypothetical protein
LSLSEVGLLSFIAVLRSVVGTSVLLYLVWSKGIEGIKDKKRIKVGVFLSEKDTLSTTCKKEEKYFVLFLSTKNQDRV